jgi:hypothetical protein
MFKRQISDQTNSNNQMAAQVQATYGKSLTSEEYQITLSNQEVHHMDVIEQLKNQHQFSKT